MMGNYHVRCGAGEKPEVATPEAYLSLFGEIPDFKKKLGTARSRGIGITMMFQNIPQMQDRFQGTQWQELIGGCDFNIFLGANDTETSSFYSTLTGMTTAQVSTERKNLNTVRITDWTPEYAQSAGEGQRPVRYEDELRHMDPDYLWLFIRGHNPIKLRKFKYYEHPESLRFRSMGAHEVIPAWRNQNGTDMRTGEAIRPKEDILAEKETDPKCLVVTDSEEFGPQRSALVRQLYKETLACMDKQMKCFPNGTPFFDKDGFIRDDLDEFRKEIRKYLSSDGNKKQSRRKHQDPDSHGLGANGSDLPPRPEKADPPEKPDETGDPVNKTEDPVNKPDDKPEKEPDDLDIDDILEDPLAGVGTEDDELPFEDFDPFE